MTAQGFDGVERRGLMFVLSSPSGAGKTTLSRMLLEREPGLKMSVSATTRAMRPGEVEGRDYFFVDKPKFETMVRQGELLEYATVFDNLYGTPRAPVEAALSAGQDVLFDIDWQGTQQLHQKASVDVVRVFILPPSAADLEKRLHTRAQDSDEVIRGRMGSLRAAEQMQTRVLRRKGSARCSAKPSLWSQRPERVRRSQAHSSYGLRLMATPLPS